jgi:hypothetical protein
MKRTQKKRIYRKHPNQLSFDFSSAIPIEIHTPRLEHNIAKKELIWDRKTAIGLVRG